MRQTPAQKQVAQALKDLRATYGGGWSLLAITPQKALILQRCVEWLCNRETPRGGIISCQELNEIRAVVRDLQEGDMI